MAAHLYWRLNVTAINGGSNLAVAELGLFVAGGASSAASGGTASASTVNGTQTAALAFDGSTSTYWQATATSGWLQYQFASAVDIQSYQLTAPPTSNQTPNSWTLQWSDDGVTFTTVDTVTKQANWNATDTRIYTVGANAGGTETGKKITGPISAIQSTVPVGTAGRFIGMRSGGAGKTVSGTVQENGAAKSGLTVVAFDKISRMPIGIAVTSGTGTYSINAQGFANVFVVGFDPTSFQAQVFDEVTPG